MSGVRIELGDGIIARQCFFSCELWLLPIFFSLVPDRAMFAYYYYFNPFAHSFCDRSSTHCARRASKLVFIFGTLNRSFSIHLVLVSPEMRWRGSGLFISATKFDKKKPTDTVQLSRFFLLFISYFAHVYRRRRGRRNGSILTHFNVLRWRARADTWIDVGR